MRPVTLSQQEYVENEIRETVFARETLFRVALEGQEPASRLTCAVDVPVRWRDVFLTIQNDDNPPLRTTGVSATRRPLYATFLAASAGTYNFLTGNSQCAAPRYELAALGDKLQSAALTPATPGALSPNPRFHVADPLAEIEPLGTSLDLAPWKYRKRVQLAQAGVQQLELDVDVLAHTDAALQDLRLIRDGRQVPYVIERTSLRRDLPTALLGAPDPKRPSVSRWKIILPQHPLPLAKLTCAAAAPYFTRPVSLSEEVPDERGNLFPHQLASATWTRTPGSKDNRLSLQVAAAQTGTLILEIENGDNPPLALEELTAWYPVTRVLFKAPAEGDLSLYYGAQVDGPRYDLQLMAPRLLAADKMTATLEREEVLKTSWTEDACFAGKAGWVFWGVLGAVVVILLFVIAKLLPKPPAPGAG
jgi:hypothetical protein